MFTYAKKTSELLLAWHHPNLLTDTSGSRRFIAISVTGRIDNHSQTNYEQLYSQARYALQKGKRYWFTPQEEAELLTPYEMLDYIRKSSRVHLPAGKLIYFGRILKKLGVRSKKGKKGTIYFVIEEKTGVEEGR